MLFRNAIIALAAFLAFSNSTNAQLNKMNVPGCGPAQEAIYKEQLALRQDAHQSAEAVTKSLRAQLASLTATYAKLGCSTSPSDFCATLGPLIAATRAAASDSAKSSNALGNATYKYRVQQPFVTPTGAACLRCKSPGDFNCPKPGTTPGFPPQELPKSLCHDAAGTWSHNSENVGSSTWHLSNSGGRLSAVESGLGGARGPASFNGSTLRIDFSTSVGIDGFYEWQLDAACRSGNGRVVFTRGRSGAYQSKVTRH